ncbi:MAG: DNA-3-methyladenine glycosylase I [Marinifilaceae bacterium]|jgi:DNA-3-methyladenine glycosylase I|nr:DNA-3-methyladenine glycosylase I [Marinifilaceae bacterium]
MEKCNWCLKTENYIDYHDNEWGIPCKDDYKLFELLCLESFQAGLSWITILNKRKNFREAFDNFNFKLIANYKQDKIDQLLENKGIIRNKLKINACINNAKAYIKIIEDYGSFANYIWAFVNFKPIHNNFSNIEEIPSSTELSDKISTNLKKKGFKFIGTTTIYSFIQASGMVNDHLISCPSHSMVKKLSIDFNIQTQK